MEPQDSIVRVITEMRDAALARIEANQLFSKAEIQQWVADFLASLQIEFPLSVKAILDKGGTVRQVVVKLIDGVVFRAPDGHPIMYEPNELFGKVCRLTIIGEPIEEPRKR